MSEPGVWHMGRLSGGTHSWWVQKGLGKWWKNEHVFLLICRFCLSWNHFCQKQLVLTVPSSPVSNWSDIHQISKLFEQSLTDYTASIVLPESVKTGIEESKSGLSRHLFPSVPQSSQEAKWLRVDDAMKWWATSCANGIPTFATSHICSWTNPMHLNQSLCDKKLAQGKAPWAKVKHVVICHVICHQSSVV